MLKTLNFGRRACIDLQRKAIHKRMFLTEAYQCKEAWKERLVSPLLKNIKVRDMLKDIENMYLQTKKVSALDVDIFANIVQTDEYIVDVLKLLEKLRLTSETSNTLESTHHAAVRLLLDQNRLDILVKVLHQRLKYGIFPDHFCYNLLMDKFLNMEDYGNAAKIAVLPMLQEDAENEITNALCLYACHKYLEKPEVWQEPEEKVPEDEEEIKVRVPYIRNPYFDNHFDITNPRDLVGKTLVFYGKRMDNVMGRSCLLRGLILHKQCDKATELINGWISTVNEDNTKLIFKEVIGFIIQEHSHIPDGERPYDLENVFHHIRMIKKEQLSKDTLNKALLDNVEMRIAEGLEAGILQQRQIYLDWDKKRSMVFEAQKKEIEKQEALNAINSMKKQLTEKDRLLTFFDKEEEIELQIEEKEAKRQKEIDKVLNMHGSARKLRKLIANDTYMPPDLVKHVK